MGKSLWLGGDTDHDPEFSRGGGTGLTSWGNTLVQVDGTESQRMPEVATNEQQSESPMQLFVETRPCPGPRVLT